MHLYKIFDGKDGLYYDPVGDEVFVAKRLGVQFSPNLNMYVPIYALEFDGDREEGITMEGVVKDHGYHVYLGPI